MANNSHLKDLQGLGPLEVLRADLDEEGSFDEAITGCDCAFLVAAPVKLKSENPESPGGGGHVLDEDSWSDVEYLTANKTPIWGYAVSKVLLEKEAYRFAQEHGISLVTLCPVVTVGAAPAPNAHTSVPNCLSLISGDEAEFRVLRGIETASGTVALVHIDDVCRAELFVAEEAAAAGRYICCSLNTTILELARFLADEYPQYDVKTNMLSGELLEKSSVPVVCEAGQRRVRVKTRRRVRQGPGDPAKLT